MWLITSQKHGVNALGLKRVLGLGSYETAWCWLHKLRRAMVRYGRDPLVGEVEVDECYLGGKEPGVIGRKALKKSIVAIAAEVRGRGIGRIRMALVKTASGAHLLPFVKSVVSQRMQKFVQTVGRAMTVLQSKDLNTFDKTFQPVVILHILSCHESIV